MKWFFKKAFWLICLSSSIGLSAAHATISVQEKIYFNTNDLEISENVICIHLEDNLIETSVLRVDQQGFYIFDGDITNYSVAREKQWKCPYCYRWWPIGQKCQNPSCPTNQW